jgi:hypothetical protein
MIEEAALKGKNPVCKEKSFRLESVNHLEIRTI